MAFPPSNEDRWSDLDVDISHPKDLPLSSAPGCLALALDDQRRVIWTNDEWLRRLGKRRHETIGKHFSEIFPRAMILARQVEFDAAFQGRRRSYQNLFLGTRMFTHLLPLRPSGGIAILVQPAPGNDPHAEATKLPFRFGASSIELGELSTLSHREREILYWVGLGLSTKHIAEKFQRAEKTVETQIASLFDKFGFHTRTELAVWAAERGLLGFSPQQWAMICEETPTTTSEQTDSH